MPRNQGPSALPPAAPKPKNAILGCFVVGALVLAFLNALVFGRFDENPFVPITAIALGAGLIISRIRRGIFGRGWLLAIAIVGILMFFASFGSTLSADRGGLSGMLIPGTLALIARLRA